MNDLTSCRRCDGRKMMVVNRIYQINGDGFSALPVCPIERPRPSVEGVFRAFICCRCGYTELYAHELQGVMANLGELSPNVRLIDGDFAGAVAALGLVKVEGAGFAGWKFLAEGIYEGVHLTIGEHTSPRRTDFGPRQMLRLEIQTKARASFGSFAIRHPNAVGLSPNRVYRQVVRTGDEAFDSVFITVYLEPVPPEILSLAANVDRPIVQIPWLDETVRSTLLASNVEQLFAVDNELALELYEYNSGSFPHALDLAVHLAKWSGGGIGPYR